MVIVVKKENERDCDCCCVFVFCWLCFRLLAALFAGCYWYRIIYYTLFVIMISLLRVFAWRGRAGW